MRDEDWCNTEKANSMDKVVYMTQMLNKHQEQKEAFLKVFLTSLVIYNNLTNLLYMEKAARWPSG